MFESDGRVENTYMLIGEKRKLRYLKYSDVKYVSRKDALDVIDRFDVVVIHSLPAIPIEIVSKIRRGIKVVWFAWGYDLYEKPYDIIRVDLLGPETKKHTKYDRFRCNTNWWILRNKAIVATHLKGCLSRIDYFSGVFPYEIDMVKSAHPEFRALPLDFYYGAKNFFVPEMPESKIIHGKRDVIIGNSANPTNNHLDVLKSISSIYHDADSKLVIPLSYGGTSDYVSKVERAAEKIAPDRVISLKTYLPLNNYLSLISNCRTAVFAHERQQASDNIFLQMIYGARVYMSETSAAYHYLKGIGLKVYSLQQNISLFNEEMRDEDIINNREILSSIYSSSKLLNRIVNINTTLMDSLENNI